MSLKKYSLYYDNKQQQRRKWNEKENELLLKLTKIFGFVKNSWRLISVAMIDSGFERSPKQCKDRYIFYLNKTNTNNELTEEELRQLLELTQKFGNKWTLIALELGNRTSQSIKNKFYAHVKKILRRLFKCTYQTYDSSQRIKQIKEGTLSNIFCGYKIYVPQKNDNFDHHELMVNKFKQLIIDHHNIKKKEVLDETTKKEVQQIYNFLIQHSNEQFTSNQLTQNTTIPKKEQNDSSLNDYFNQISNTSQQIKSEADLDYYIIQDQYSHKIQDEDNDESEPAFLN